MGHGTTATLQRGPTAGGEGSIRGTSKRSKLLKGPSYNSFGDSEL